MKNISAPASGRVAIMMNQAHLTSDAPHLKIRTTEVAAVKNHIAATVTVTGRNAGRYRHKKIIAADSAAINKI